MSVIAGYAITENIVPLDRCFSTNTRMPGRTADAIRAGRQFQSCDELMATDAGFVAGYDGDDPRESCVQRTSLERLNRRCGGGGCGCRRRLLGHRRARLVPRGNLTVAGR